MDRVKVKRILALLKAQIEYPDRVIEIEVEDLAGFKQSFENQKFFRGWVNYHETWDVDPDDVWVVVPRSRSLVAEWHEELMKVVPVISPDGTITEA